MTSYRLGILAEVDRAPKVLVLDCDSDAAAGEVAANSLQPAQQAQIWQGARLVGTVIGKLFVWKTGIRPVPPSSVS